MILIWQYLKNEWIHRWSNRAWLRVFTTNSQGLENRKTKYPQEKDEIEFISNHAVQWNKCGILKAIISNFFHRMRRYFDVLCKSPHSACLRSCSDFDHRRLRRQETPDTRISRSVVSSYQKSWRYVSTSTAYCSSK